MPMMRMRLFIGGLDKNVDRQALGARLSHYGSISNIEVKEKTDLDGNIVHRFSFVNIEAPATQISECIKHLNGTVWQGSHLKVEAAKESFLDRLNRERAATQQQQQLPYSEKTDKLTPTVKSPKVDQLSPVVKSPKVVKKKFGETDSKRSRKDSDGEDFAHLDKKGCKIKKKDKQTNNEDIHDEMKVTEDTGNMEEDQGEIKRKKKKKKKRKSEGESSAAETEPTPMIKHKSKKKNKAEEEMMSSFKNFSSVWADTDSEDNEDGQVNNSHTGNMDDGSDQDSNSDKNPAKLSSVKSATARRKTKSEKVDRIGDSDDSDATIDDGADNCPDFTDVREEQRMQLEILANLNGSDKGSTKASTEDSSSTVKHMMRYDPTLATHQQFRVQSSSKKQEVKEMEMSGSVIKDKYVRVSKDLNFGQKSSGFSFLDKFSQQKKEEGEKTDSEEEVAPVVAVSEPTVTPQHRVKKKPFFLQPNDKRIEAATEWMVQSLTDEVVKEFEKAQPEIRMVIKTRTARNKREQRNLKGRGRGRAVGNPNRDERWRRVDTKK